jgi:hypothetical protein
MTVGQSCTMPLGSHPSAMICLEFASHNFHPFGAGLGTLPIDLH